MLRYAIYQKAKIIWNKIELNEHCFFHSDTAAAAGAAAAAAAAAASAAAPVFTTVFTVV